MTILHVTVVLLVVAVLLLSAWCLTIGRRIGHVERRCRKLENVALAVLAPSESCVYSLTRLEDHRDSESR